MTSKKKIDKKCCTYAACVMYDYAINTCRKAPLFFPATIHPLPVVMKIYVHVSGIVIEWIQYTIVVSTILLERQSFKIYRT